MGFGLVGVVFGAMALLPKGVWKVSWFWSGRMSGGVRLLMALWSQLLTSIRQA